MALLRPALVLACLVLMVLVAGCGGGGESSSTEVNSGSPSVNPDLPKERFITAADAACSDYRAKRGRIEREIEAIESGANPDSAVSEAQLGELLRDALTDADVELATIRELEPPAGDEATIEKLLGIGEVGNALAAEIAGAVEEGNTARVRELAKEGEAINARAEKIAGGYGLKVCARAP